MAKVYIKKDTRIDSLMVNPDGGSTVGIQITPEIAAKIIAELANYLLESAKKEDK
jgi:hypothetical protein